MIGRYKGELLEGGVDLIDKMQKAKKQHDATINKLYRQTWQLKVENNF